MIRAAILTLKRGILPPFGGVIPRLVPLIKTSCNKRILNVNPVQTNIRTEVVQILGRNPMKTPIKQHFLGVFAATFHFLPLLPIENALQPWQE